MDKPKGNKDLLSPFCVVLTTCFGIGYTVSWGGGTIASLVGLFLYITIKSQAVFFVLTIIILILGFSLSGRAEAIFKEKDSKKIVIDDLGGMMVSFLFIPKHPGFLLATFFLFRAIDCLKIYPINKIEKLPKGAGVVGDDLLAGVYTNILMQIFRIIFRNIL